MVGITSDALIAALANQFAAARQGQVSGGPGQLGPLGSGEAASNTAPGLGGSSVGGVPGTATTGPSIANALLGGSPQSVGAGPVSQQVANTLLGQRSDAPERPNVPGGSVGTLLALLTGGAAAVPGIFGSLVTSDALGLPPDPNLLSLTGLAQLADESDPAQRLTRIDPGGNVIDNTTFAQPVRIDPFGNIVRPERERATRPERTADQRSSGGFSGSRSTAR